MKPTLEQLDPRLPLATLLVDCDGRPPEPWGEFTAFAPPYRGDCAALVQAVDAVFARFALDVRPGDGPPVEGQEMLVVVGGKWSDWFGYYAGGTAAWGGFLNTNPSVAFVFADSLGNIPSLVTTAVAHETGHLLGLNHQAASGYVMSVYASASTKWSDSEVTTIGAQLGFDPNYVAPVPVVSLTVQAKSVGYRKWEWRVEADKLPAGTYEVKATWTTALPKTVQVVAGKTLIIRLTAKVAGPILLRKI